jgi:hypothetical protein
MEHEISFRKPVSTPACARACFSGSCYSRFKVQQHGSGLTEKDMHMPNTTIIALSLVIVLSGVSAALAAPNRPLHPHHQTTPSAESASPDVDRHYCSSPRNGPGFGNEPDYIAIQDEDECTSN